MKNQYFGDVKDYLTYGLLRTLVRVSDLRIGVAWMLTPDEPDGEGELRVYLSQPERWQPHDSELFNLLKQVPERGRAVEFARRLGLIPAACYFQERVPERQEARRAYFQRLFTALSDCDLLFFDPDNGLETKTTLNGDHRSVQHLYWDEATQAFHQHGFSLLIFQHFPRRSREEYLEERAQQFARRLDVARVEWFQTAQVVFFLVARPEHAAALEKAPAAVQAQWGARIWPGSRVFLSPELAPEPTPEPTASGLPLAILPGRLAVCRLAPDAAVPAWAGGSLTAITRTPEELSIVCAQDLVPPGTQAEVGWRALKVEGALDFGLTGILSSLAGSLAAAGISIFALSTYNTDYLLVKEENLARAVRTLRAAGHSFPPTLST